MITASSGFISAMEASSRKYDIKIEVTRNDSNATPIDISDRVISYSTSHEFESRNGRLNLELDNYDYALSPLNRDSSFNQKSGVYDPLIDANHKVELFEGIIVNGDFEYVKKFEGYMGDEIGVSSSPTITLSCRDKSKLMQDVYIYQGPSYSLYLVEEVIQDLINEFMPNSGITVEVLTPTQYMIGRPDGAYTPKDTNLWDACQLLADSASHELRFLEDGTLIMRKIDRDFIDKTPQLSLNLSSLISDEMSISDADVRNHIVIKVQGFDPITKEDDESIAKYGRRYMEVHRSMSDIITDVSQAHELGEGILRDLRFANPYESAEIPFHPLVQVGDIVEITNPRLGTNPTYDIFKVTTVNNQYSAERKRTRLELQGHDKFLSEPSIAPNRPTNLTAQNKSRIIQNYPNSGWVGYEKHNYFPMLSWTPPTRDIEGNVLEDNFGGYIIERGHQLDRSLSRIVAIWRFETIASIPSYIGALNLKIDYFYDYSSALLILKYMKIGTTGIVKLRYRITAINKRGVKSSKSDILELEIPVPRTLDDKGNYM
jgi:hypothetical protein